MIDTVTLFGDLDVMCHLQFATIFSARFIELFNKLVKYQGAWLVVNQYWQI